MLWPTSVSSSSTAYIRCVPGTMVSTCFQDDGSSARGAARRKASGTATNIPGASVAEPPQSGQSAFASASTVGHRWSMSRMSAPWVTIASAGSTQGASC